MWGKRAEELKTFHSLLEQLVGEHERVLLAKEELDSDNAALHREINTLKERAESGISGVNSMETQNPECDADATEGLQQASGSLQLAAIQTGDLTESAPANPKANIWPVWLSAPKLVHADSERANISRLSISTTTATTPSMQNLQYILQGTRKHGQVALLGGATRRSAGTRWTNALGQWVLPPNHRVRLTWDWLSILILCYDMAMIPLAAFQIGESGEYGIVQTCLTSFWTLDVVLNFFSGFYSFGISEMRLSEIARRYLKGPFTFDMVIILADWLLILSTYIDGSALRLMRMNKIMRFGKIFRLIRLLRVLKLPRVMQDIADAVNSDSFSIIISVVQAVLFIVVVNHFVACTWYAISDSVRGDTNEPAWVDVFHEENRDTIYRYLTALHWSLTQFMPASMEVQPRNTIERAFVIVVVFVALIVFSSFVSTITAAMVKIRMHNQHVSEQQERIRRFMMERKISLNLSSRISAVISSTKVLARKRVLEKQVDAFKSLPTELKLQLHWEAHRPVLDTVPALFQMGEFDQLGMLEVCHTAVGETFLAAGDDLFDSEQEATHCYLVLSGRLEYMDVGAKDVTKTLVCKHEGRSFVLCEAALWLKYRHAGRATGKVPADIMSVSCHPLHYIALHRPALHKACSVFAISFCELIQDVHEGDWDVWQDVDKEQVAAQRSFEAAFASAPEFLENYDTASQRNRDMFKERGDKERMDLRIEHDSAIKHSD